MKKVIPEDSVLIPDQAELVFKGVIFEFYQWPQTMFDGSAETFEMLKRPDTICAVCIVDNKILVLDEEQPNSGTRKGFPSGRAEASDPSVIHAAQREVREETGYNFKNWRLVKVTQPFTKIEWFIYFLVAWGVTSTEPVSLDAGEKIMVNHLSFYQVKQLIAAKAGYLGQSSELFDGLNSLEELLELPEYNGKSVDR